MITRLIHNMHGILRVLADWPGWEPQDRTMILDMQRQVGHLERRYARREQDMKRTKLSRRGE